MNAHELLYRSYNIKQDDVLTQAHHLANDWSISNCIDAKKIKVFNSDLGKYVDMLVPCGECYHCVETKINQWVSRMWLESQDYEYCFFITLTYKPYDKYSDIPLKLLDAFWHYDDFNFNHRPCFSPCIVRLEHFQKFIRNLRNDLRSDGKNADLSYYTAAELGKTYARPHFHVVLWSHERLVPADIEKAWSIRKGRKNMLFSSIGDVDFNNLCENGTFVMDDSIRIDGQMYNAQNAFSYVCKYVGKVEKPKTDRLKYMFDWLHSHDFDNASVQLYDLIFNDRFCNSFLKDVPALDYPEDMSEENALKHVLDEKLLALSFDDFVKLFATFHTSSRAHGIGALWLNRNIDYLAKGTYRLPESTFGALVFPSFFFRKIKEYIAPLGVPSFTGKNVSHIKCDRPRLLEEFQGLSMRDCVMASALDSTIFVHSFFSTPADIEEREQEIIRKCSLKNLYTGHRYVITWRDHVIYDDSDSDNPFCVNVPFLSVREYVYSRSDRKYMFVRLFSFDELVDDYIVPWLTAGRANAEELERERESKLLARQDAEERLNDFLEPFGSSFIELCREAVDRHDNERAEYAKKRALERKLVNL